MRAPNREMPVLVPALQRAAAMLDMLAESPVGLTLGEIAERLALPKSSTHNLCWTLVQLGQMRRNHDGTFQLGTALLRYAQAFGEQTDLTREFKRALSAAPDLPDATFLLSVLDGSDVVYLSSRNGTHPMGVNFRVGMRLPALYAATGKAILATMPVETVRSIHGEGVAPRLTRHGVATLEAYLKQANEIRKRGYAVDVGEVREGMVFYAAPVFDGHHPCAVAAVSMSVYSAKPSKSDEKLASASILHLAAALSARLGGRP
jgi:DNA-binding IclR family transcriptional regulator